MLTDLLKSLLQSPRRDAKRKRARALFETATKLRQSGDLEGARRALEESLALDPDNAETHRWLGALHAGGQSYASAVAHLERALAIDPRIENGWLDLGIVHHLQHDYAKAAASFRAGLALDPDSVAARLNLGIALKEGGRLDEALTHLREAYRRAPRAEGTLGGLVIALIAADACEEALSVAEGAVRLDPLSYEAHKYHGLSCQKLHDPLRALASYDTALEIRPDDAEIHDNRGTAFLELGRLPEAMESYDRALSLQPGFPLALFHRALARLLLGDFARGWDDYELRMLDADYPRHPDTFPRWRGEPLADRAILVRREQGLGDEIMFASCLPQLIAGAGRCYVECEPRLLGLFRRSFPAATLFASAPDGSLPGEMAAEAIDWAVPLGSVPGFMRRSLASFPRHDGYLRADPQRVARWRTRLDRLGPGLKVGVSWEGGVRKTRRALRSLALDHWLSILRTPGAKFVSLQYGSGATTAIASLNDRHGLSVEHWNEALSDYEETAALVCALDLVVSVCTAVIHLGGALGRPVWVMAPYSPEWRYGFSGDTMPWYPSVKIFRQAAYGEWGAVTDSVADQLRRLAGAAGG